MIHTLSLCSYQGAQWLEVNVQDRGLGCWPKKTFENGWKWLLQHASTTRRQGSIYIYIYTRIHIFRYLMIVQKSMDLVFGDTLPHEFLCLFCVWVAGDGFPVFSLQQNAMEKKPGGWTVKAPFVLGRDFLQTNHLHTVASCKPMSYKYTKFGHVKTTQVNCPWKNMCETGWHQKTK